MIYLFQNRISNGAKLASKHNAYGYGAESMHPEVSFVVLLNGFCAVFVCVKFRRGELLNEQSNPDFDNEQFGRIRLVTSDGEP